MPFSVLTISYKYSKQGGGPITKSESTDFSVEEFHARTALATVTISHAQLKLIN